MSRDCYNFYSSGWNEELKNIVSKPKIVGYYSVDGDRKYLSDSSRLMYYKPIEDGKKIKNVCLDLNEGIESAVHGNPDEHGSISHLLQWIELNHANIRAFGNNESWLEPKFVCSAGLLSQVLRSQYIGSDNWIVCAAKWRGTIYMCRFDKPPDRLEPQIRQKFGSWGYKFEQYMLSDDPRKDPDTSAPVIETAEFRCLFHRRIANHSILFSAEMDGLRSKTALKDPLPLDDLRFVELKTSIQISTPSQHRNFTKFKLLHWWAQCYIADNKELLCGFRDEAGIVRKLETFTLDEIVAAKNSWDPLNCVMELVKFLDKVDTIVVDDCDKTIYKFERKPYSAIGVEKVSPNSEYGFLPSSYIAATRFLN